MWRAVLVVEMKSEVGAGLDLDRAPREFHVLGDDRRSARVDRTGSPRRGGGRRAGRADRGEGDEAEGEEDALHVWQAPFGCESD